MNKPICDFVNKYKENNKIRLHMPGHKGKNILGFEALDITEIDGADSLYLADGIIRESEANATTLYNHPTFYSAEGSSLAIRAMLFLALTKAKNNIILAARNVHKTFITACSLLDLDVRWLYSKESNSYHSCIITASDVEEVLSTMNELPFALYLTSPDYLGNILDIKSISDVCKKYNVLLLVDNAHGAYLKFLNNSLFPLDLGASMCASSAHKTLPSLTGGAYLQISNELDDYYKSHAKEALGMFGSTSPSYLILESLDNINYEISNNNLDFKLLSNKIAILKEKLINNGYKLAGNEPIKITIDTRAYGYTGYEIAEYLNKNNIVSEFYDNDYLVLMLTPLNNDLELKILENTLLKSPKKEPLNKVNFSIINHEKSMSIREASFSLRERINIEDASGRILADTAVTCPPAVPILVCGEVITDSDILMFKYYGINEISVVKEED